MYVSAHIICLLILQNSYRAVAYFVLLMQSVTKQRKRIYRSHSFQKVDDCEGLYFNPCWWEIFLLFSGILFHRYWKQIHNCTLWTFRSLGAKFHYNATILNMQRECTQNCESNPNLRLVLLFCSHFIWGKCPPCFLSPPHSFT